MLEHYLITNREGTCLTEEGLDAIWPRDDRPPLLVDGKSPFKLPPTCEEGTLTLEEEVGRDVLISHVFDGDPLPPPVVPLPGGALLLITALTMALVWRTIK